MTRMRNACLYLVLISTLFVFGPACGDGMQVRHSFGGRASALEIVDDYWYQAVGDKLIVLTKNGGSKVTTIILAQDPASGSCKDLLHSGDRMFALLDGREVVAIDVSVITSPKIIHRHTTRSLGIIPRALLLVNGWPVVIGDGGAVRLSDGSRLVECEGAVTGVTMSINLGVVYASDRRVYDSDTGEFLGSATQLICVDNQANADMGTIVYTRDLDGETEVGLMSSSVRDIDAIEGKLRALF